MNRIVSVAEMRALEERAAERGLPGPVLLEQAGQAVAAALRARFALPSEILFLIGPGNNGGDGLVAARELARAGYRVMAYLWNRRREPDPVLEPAEQVRVVVRRAETDSSWTGLRAAIERADVIVDALLGIGHSRPIGGPLAGLLEVVAETRRRNQTMVALDLPSGLNADTGALDPETLPADLTLTLGAAKWGLLRAPGDAAVGELMVLDIGIPDDLEDPAWPKLIGPEWVARLVPRRARHGNKGTFGRVLVVAGSTNYYGAAALATEAAYRAGAGLVTLATPASLIPIFATKLTEATFWPLPEDEPGRLGPAATPEIERALAACDAALLGPGLSLPDSVVTAIESLLPVLSRWGHPVVLDADALNALARIDGWWDRLRAPAVLTPHPGEFSRLTRRPIPEIQAQREAIAQSAAAKWRQTVILKGAYTVVAAPAEPIAVSPLANPLLASAGTGDVLAGVIAGLLAQSADPGAAAIAGVWLHGTAAAWLTADYGDAGLLARELLPVIPRIRQRLLAEHARDRGRRTLADGP